MKKIKIITDSCSDISLETAQKYGIHLLPVHLYFGDETYLDRYEISTEEFYKKLRQTDIHPKTSLITVQEHMDAYKKYVNDYTIIHIPMSSSTSGTYQSAQLAKESVIDEVKDADIRIVENCQLSYGYGMWVIEAAKMANDGKSAEEIISMLEDKIKLSEVIFSVTGLDYLKKGGRISQTAKILADVLDISPILKVESGLVVNKDKVRGKKKIIPKMVDILINEASENTDNPIFVMCGGDLEKANLLKDKILEKTAFKNIYIEDIGPCIGIHAGPDTLGLIFEKK